MSAQLSVTIGADRYWGVQCWLDGGSTPASFGASDAITAYVYRGQDQSQLFSLSVAPYTDNGGTGYAGGQLKLGIANADSSALERLGTYLVRAWWTPQGSSQTFAIWSGTLLAEPAAGTSGETTVAYCSYQEMLDLGSWAEILGSDADTEGFYVQRLRAREWLDWTILNNYRGAYVGLFEQHSTLAFEFGYAGWRRSLGPSPSLVTYLQQNMMIVRPQIVEACAHYALARVGLSQVGLNNQFASYGCYHRDMATRCLIGTTAEIDLNGDGIGELFINLSSTNTLFT